MKDLHFIKLLNRKLARELFHFIRDGGRLLRKAYIEEEQKRFIEKHLDFLRTVMCMIFWSLQGWRSRKTRR